MVLQQFRDDGGKDNLSHHVVPVIVTQVDSHLVYTAFDSFFPGLIKMSDNHSVKPLQPFYHLVFIALRPGLKDRVKIEFEDSYIVLHLLSTVAPGSLR